MPMTMFREAIMCYDFAFELIWTNNFIISELKIIRSVTYFEPEMLADI